MPKLTEDHVKFGVRLEGILEMTNERVRNVFEHLAFGLRVRHLLARDQLGFFQHLHGEDLAGVFLAHLHHFAETAFANHLRHNNTTVCKVRATGVSSHHERCKNG
jgi:hypothetical protein